MTDREQQLQNTMRIHVLAPTVMESIDEVERVQKGRSGPAPMYTISNWPTVRALVN